MCVSKKQTNDKVIPEHKKQSKLRCCAVVKPVLNILESEFNPKYPRKRI